MTTATTTAGPGGAGPAGDHGDVPARYRAHLSRGRAKLGELFGGDVEVSSAGCRVRTARGRDYLNCGGYGVFLTGACHPRVVAAVERQIRTLPLSTRLLLEPRAADAATALARVAPPGLERVHFTGSGAEAVETALKLARSQGHRRIVATEGGYHGKTLGALSATGRALYQDPFRPLLPDTVHVPYGDAAALAGALGEDGSDAVVLVEPVQGEAGVIIPPDGYLRRVAEVCRRTGAFLVLDEVMTGLGRLGHWWGADREGVVPDVLLAGKSLSGGVVPVAAAIATPRAFRAFDRDPFLHTSTFSAAPVAMAAARAAVAVIDEEGLVERSRALGDTLLPLLRGSLLAHCPHLVREVRGMGLLLGVEFRDGGLAGEFLLELLDLGVIANHSLNAHAVVRLTPPAVLSDEETGELAAAVEAAARALGERFGPQDGTSPTRSD
ncbi:aminotransferase class III-fold pyridoxal phosphate-dependent enzyme [Streptomyces griseoflavus]|uniref:aspartate aminotransferase family protein n=1 Tax=Streptomyces griseoflavus TaxID=35619 RepID=UPI00167D35C3|nr:aminotransferase class III-fold pyridoxal phosphate-dependent enzyme [Streptomyces griseoflavus]GGV28917.1 putative ornithine aminotransferase [Streptomyces griseoflavus]